MNLDSTRKLFAGSTPSQDKLERIAITDLSRLAFVNRDLEDFTRQALEVCMISLDADAAQLLELLPDGASFRLQSGAGLETDVSERTFIPTGTQSQAGITLKSLEPVIVADLQEETRFTLCRWEQKHKFASGLSVPVPGNDDPHGVLIVYSYQKEHFSADQAPILQGIAALLAFSKLRDQVAGLENLVFQKEEQHKYYVGKLREEIHEREKTEQELSESEKVLRSLFESAPDATILVDAQGKIERVNERVEDLFGYKAKELVHKEVETLLPERFQSRHFLERAHYTKSPYVRPMGSGLELYARRKDGTEFPVDIMISPVETQDGLLTLAAIRDSTERKLIENELAEVQRHLIDSTEAERLYLAQELHDGPMQDLYGVSFELSSLGNELPSQEIDRQLQAATKTIQDVINVLRGICGNLRPPTLAQFGLEKSIRSHVEGLVSLHPEIEFQLNLAADGQLLPERVRLALFRIYQHAISNVIRHAEAHNVMISLAIETENVLLEVKDDGKGFKLPARWIKLAREDHLGLLGTAERAQAIGAQLTIESDPGAGTCISVSVPRNPEQALLQAKGSPFRIIRTRR